MLAFRQLKVVLPSDLSVGPFVSDLVRIQCSQLPLSAEDVATIDISVAEAVTNIVEHAYEFAPHCEFELCFDVYEDRLVVLAYDCGRSIPPTLIERARTAAGSDEPPDLASLAERGRGLFILVRAMDEVAYRTVNGENILALTKRFTERGRRRMYTTGNGHPTTGESDASTGEDRFS